MRVTSDAVRTELAAATTPYGDEATTIAVPPAVLEIDERRIEHYVDALVSCELARRLPNGRVQVTVTGSELLALGSGDSVIIDMGEK